MQLMIEHAKDLRKVCAGMNGHIGGRGLSGPMAGRAGGGTRFGVGELLRYYYGTWKRSEGASYSKLKRRMHTLAAEEPAVCRYISADELAFLRQHVSSPKPKAAVGAKKSKSGESCVLECGVQSAHYHVDFLRAVQLVTIAASCAADQLLTPVPG